MERKVASILNEKGVDFIRQKHFDWLGKQSLDFYLSDYNIAIECQGIQHFEPVEYFGGEKALKHQIYKDSLKKKLCLEHGIKVEYISYNEKITERLKTILV